MRAIEVVVEATAPEADGPVEANAGALCPDDDHDGYCPVPWSTVTTALTELEGDEARAWQEVLERASDVGRGGVG